MRKSSYKIRVNFGPVVGKLWSSAQITNYSRAQLIGRTVVGAVNLGDKTLPTGFVSQFLVLGALDPDGTVRLLELPDGVLPGSMVA
jgi:tRNA-binding protein